MLVLHNMVGLGEVDEELEDEVREGLGCKVLGFYGLFGGREFEWYVGACGGAAQHGGRQ